MAGTARADGFDDSRGILDAQTARTKFQMSRVPPSAADAQALERTVLAADDPATVADAFLSARAPERDPTVEEAAALVDLIATSPDITRVGELADRAGVGTRALQRLFAEYVGVGPKWVIRIHRLQEAARAAGGVGVNWSQLATDLGYSDQPHFTRDFTAIVGIPPARYARGRGGPDASSSATSRFGATTR